MLAWQRARPGEKLLEVDVPLSYGMDVCQPSPSNNSVEFMWDPTKEVGVYIKVRGHLLTNLFILNSFIPSFIHGTIDLSLSCSYILYSMYNLTKELKSMEFHKWKCSIRMWFSLRYIYWFYNNWWNIIHVVHVYSTCEQVNCISTEFTPKKHGGEKGVPFRIQVETRLPGGPRLHAASCQVKVFKLKGADRKHKQDRDKILRRPAHEQDKYQPSYDCTVLSDVSFALKISLKKCRN